MACFLLLGSYSEAVLSIMAKKAIFLDRDDTLIKDPGYISDPNQVALLDGVPEALQAFRKMGFQLVLVTNQSAVARGIITEQQLQSIHERLDSLLAQQNCQLDNIYYCPYHPDGTVEKYRQTSVDRKPNPGMLLKAAKDMKLNLETSWCIGDRISDIEAGARAGCRTIMISKTSPVSDATADSQKPDFIAVNLREAVNIVKQQQRSERKRSRASSTKKKTTPETEASTESPTPTASPKESDAAPANKAKAKISTTTHNLEKITTEAPPPETNRTEQMLQAIQDQLHGFQRHNMFDEFSVFRLIAGITQMVVILCLVIAVWLLIGTEKQYESVFTALGFAMVFQMMSLTFFIIRNRQ